ncbi:universal stress protein [Corynebacterium sp. SCR221107]|uniref:universal stress protein n=1 Tax=Corynebacterium sp. SCR221107 TaxID=3017361 RepID=UPI0022EC6E27|nr:universal stress protein [Corynebacterium sp. SCR221107]WBT08610.1 universal stress protein [Corynebacterium sp. SCR221107]
MSSPILVGYLANEQGKAALTLGCQLARSIGTSVEIVMVTGHPATSGGAYPHAVGPDPIVEKQLSEWLAEALSFVPGDVAAQARIVAGRSSAKALATTAQYLGCQMIVVGSAETSIFTRLLAGSVSHALLSGSPVPVAVAPLGYNDPSLVSRVSCMYDPLHGDFQLFRYALEHAEDFDVELRVITLGVGDDLKGSTGVVDTAESLRSLGIDVDGLVQSGRMAFVKAIGKTLRHAITEITWRDGEITIIGSTREASDGRVSAGPFATKLISAIPTPAIMCPAGQFALHGK